MWMPSLTRANANHNPCLELISTSIPEPLLCTHHFPQMCREFYKLGSAGNRTYWGRPLVSEQREQTVNLYIRQHSKRVLIKAVADLGTLYKLDHFSFGIFLSGLGSENTQNTHFVAQKTRKFKSMSYIAGNEQSVVLYTPMGWWIHINLEMKQSEELIILKCRTPTSGQRLN